MTEKYKLSVHFVNLKTNHQIINKLKFNNNNNEYD